MIPTASACPYCGKAVSVRDTRCEISKGVFAHDKCVPDITENLCLTDEKNETVD